MNKLLTLIFISISVACLGQSKKTVTPSDKKTLITGDTKLPLLESVKDQDSTIELSVWHMQQIAAFDAEIKRLGGTTIEAEQQRIYNQKQLLINSAIASKVNTSRIKDIGQVNGNKVPLILTPNKPK